MQKMSVQVEILGLQQFRLIILEREGPDCLSRLICRGPDFAALSEHQLSGFGCRKNGGGMCKLLWGYRALDRDTGRQAESMASRRKILIEILSNRGFIGGDSVS